MEVLLARDVADLAGSAVKSERQKAAQQLLLQLYVRAPHVITRLPKTSFAQFDDRKTLLTAVPCSILHHRSRAKKVPEKWPTMSLPSVKWLPLIHFFF